jgi:hypothetical protein
LSPGCGTGRTDEAGIVGGHEEVAALAPQVAHDRRARPLEDLDDAADPFAGALSRYSPVDPGHHGVARQGDSRVVGCDLDGRLVALSVDDHEGGTACPELNYAFD